MHQKGPLTIWGTWLGALALTVVPLAHVDGINRFTLLPQVGVLLSLTLCGVSVWLWKARGIPSHPAATGVQIFLGVQVVAALLSAKPALALLPLSTEVGYILLFLFLLASLKPASCETIARAAAVGAVVVSAIGLVQTVGGFSSIPSSAQPSATLGHRNLAAAYVVAVTPYLVWEAFRSPDRRGRLLWWLGVGVSIAFVVATRSRAAWLGGAVAAAVALFALARGRIASPSVRKYGVGMAVAAVVVLVSAVRPSGPTRGEAMWHEKRTVLNAARSVVDDGGDKGRLRLGHRTLEMIANQPIIGVGPGHWRIVYPAVARGDMIDSQAAPIRPHNDLLWIWAESGSLAIATFLIVVCWVVRDGWLAVGNVPVTLAVLCSVCATIVSGLFGFSREFPATWLPLWVGLAMLLSTAGNVEINQRRLQAAWLSVFVLLAGSGLVVVAQSIRFDRHHLQARLAAAQDDWKTVEREATAALAVGALNEEPLLLRGRALEAMGRPHEALRDYGEGLAWAPNDIGFWIGFGNGLRARGDREGAFEAYRTASAIDPFDSRIHNNLGTMHAASGRLDSATVWLEKAATSKSKTTDVYANLSVVYRRTGNVEQALDVAEAGLGRDSTHAGLWNALGSAAAEAGDGDRALMAFRQALALDSTLAQPRFNLARVHESAGSIDSAVAAYRTVLLHAPDPNDPRLEFVRQKLKTLAP